MTTVEDYANWSGRSLTPAQQTRVGLYLGAAETLIRRIAAPSELPDSLPDDLVAIQVDMVTRATTIPAGKTQERIGDYTWVGSGGLGATADEVDRIREATGLSPFVEIQLSGVMPTWLIEAPFEGEPDVH